MFSNILLEKLVRPSRAGGGLNESYNQIAQDAFNRGILGAKSQYAPYTEYANALSKEAYSKFLPYQIQAQILSNPLVWQAFKDKPDELNAMLKNFSSSIPSPNSSGIPSPESSKNIFRHIVDYFTGKRGNHGQGPGIGNQMQTQLPTSDILTPNTDNYGKGPNDASPNDQQLIFNDQARSTGGNAEQVQGATIPPYKSSNVATGRLVPKGGMEGTATKMTAGYSESPYKPNTIVRTPAGEAITTPGSELISSSQKLDIAIKNITPLLSDIAKNAEKWTSPGMAGKLKIAQGLNLVRQNMGDIGGFMPKLLKQTGLTTKDLTDYADWQANQEKAVDTLMSLYNLPQNELSLRTVKNIIHPLPGEGKEYKDRMLKELYQLNKRADVMRKAISEGTELLPKNNASGSQNDNVIIFEGKKYMKEGNKWRIVSGQ